VKKLNEKTAEELIDQAGKEEKNAAFIEGDLAFLQDEKRTFCLNDQSDHSFKNIFVDSDAKCVSDCDAQLLITIGYKEIVTLKNIKFIASRENGPKVVKLFVNSPNLSFDETDTVSPTQILNITASDLEVDAKPLNLNQLKFRNADSLTVFVESNQSGGTATEINRLIVNGSKA